MNMRNIVRNMLVKLSVFPLFLLSIKPFGSGGQAYPPIATTVSEYASLTPQNVPQAWEGRSIGMRRLRLVEFQAFIERTRDPDNVSPVPGCDL